MFSVAYRGPPASQTLTIHQGTEERFSDRLKKQELEHLLPKCWYLFPLIQPMFQTCMIRDSKNRIPQDDPLPSDALFHISLLNVRRRRLFLRLLVILLYKDFRIFFQNRFNGLKFSQCPLPLSNIFYSLCIGMTCVQG